MGLTVIVNSMTVSHKGSDGLSIAFPDVCKTPVLGVPVPIPYPNIAMSSDLKKGSKKVKCDEKKVVLKSSKIKTSMGDEVGVQKGIISNKQMGKGKFANYSFDVKFEGKNVCRLLDPTTQNRSSLNTAAFAHLQAPKSASGPNATLIEGACEEVEAKKAEQDDPKNTAKPAAGPGTSGIIQDHWDAMKAYLDDAQPSFMIYFRSSGEHVGKWIEKNKHEPKPHEWIDGLSCKPGRRSPEKAEPQDDLIESWIVERMEERKHKGGWMKLSPEIHKMVLEGTLLLTPDGHPRELLVKNLDGVIISHRDAYGNGRPIIGRKQWNGLDFRHEWMTGDYDMMDIIKEKEVCKRPSSEEYGKLKFELNQAMGWPGIQHGPQATWNTAADEEFKGVIKDKDGKIVKGKNFSVAQEISGWMHSSVQGSPADKNAAAAKVTGDVVINEKGEVERSIPLIDDKLTILGPGGGLYLEKASDYWDALACCGCIDPGVEPDTKHLEESEEWKEKSAEIETKPWKGEGDEKPH